MFHWRLLLGTLIIAALVGLCWLDHLAAVPGIWLAPVAVLITIAATGEVLELSKAGGMHPPAWAVYSGNLLLLASGWLPGVCRQLAQPAALPGRILPCKYPLAGCSWPLLALVVGLVLVLVGQMRRYRGPGGATANLAAGALALVYVGVMLCFVVQLRMLWGVGGLASLLIVVKLSDTGAYAVGRLIGRHKLAPVLSPAKTVEGALGGLAFGCLGSWAMFAWLVPATGPAKASGEPWWGWLLFGLLLGLAGLLGDLAESLLKRDVGRKDSSSWLPGLGGALDILDSILLAAPVAWLCWALGLVGG
jgi:phosphatidate cytidylyltransferase